MVFFVSFVKIFTKRYIMKKFFILAAGIALLASCSGPNKDRFTIRGTVDSTISEWVYLQKRDDGPLQKIDSAQIQDGKFRFEGTIRYPEVYYINIPSTRSLVPFFVEPSSISVDVVIGDINNTIIKGSETQKQFEAYLDHLEKFNQKLDEYYDGYVKASEAGNTAEASRLDSLLMAEDENRANFIKQFALDNNASFVSPYIVYQNSYNYDLESLDKAMRTFDASLDSSKYIGFLNDYLNILRRTAVGQRYVTFMMQDSTGIFVPVADLVGEKYLLIDFWASWCSPCRAENPNLVALYGEYKDRGFEILGVSFDTSRERWLKAIKDDNLTWPQVSDLAGWGNKAGKVYGIRSIPSNVIIDPSGIIIAKNLRGDELKAKLQEIFPPDA